MDALLSNKNVLWTFMDQNMLILCIINNVFRKLCIICQTYSEAEVTLV